MVDMVGRESADGRSRGHGGSPSACDFCGALAPGDADLPLSWVVSVEGGVARAYCEQCSREHLRSIEAKLDSEWW